MPTPPRSQPDPPDAPPADTTIERALSRGDLVVVSALAAAAGLAWLWLLRVPMAGHASHAAGMEGMGGEVWSTGYLLPAFAMWALMMIAMMLPSAAPIILLQARVARQNGSGARAVAISAAAYLTVWTGFSAAAALGQALLISLGALSALTLTVGSRVLAALLLAAAALYQLSGIKQACLDRCRSPLSFVMRLSRPGAAGAFRLGLAHGLYCLGCCWALMLLLFVGGVMNLAWVATLAAIVLAEKVAPGNWPVGKMVAFILALGAVLLLIGPAI